MDTWVLVTKTCLEEVLNRPYIASVHSLVGIPCQSNSKLEKKNHNYYIIGSKSSYTFEFFTGGPLNQSTCLWVFARESFELESSGSGSGSIVRATRPNKRQRATATQTRCGPVKYSICLMQTIAIVFTNSHCHTTFFTWVDTTFTLYGI